MGKPKATSEKPEKGAGILDSFPNNYQEKPLETRDTVYAAFDNDVGENHAKLTKLGKIATLVQYFTLIVALCSLISLQIYRGVQIQYSLSGSALTYEGVVGLLNDENNVNAECKTTNQSLVYNSFVTFDYNQSAVCTWVKEDLEKDGLPISKNYDGMGPSSGNSAQEMLEKGRWFPLKSKLGTYSACKSLFMKEEICEMVLRNCKQGKILMDDTITQLLKESVPIGTFYKEDVLNYIVQNELKTSIQSIKSSLVISAKIVNQWAGANMPRLGSTMQHFLNRLQGIHAMTFDQTERSPGSTSSDFVEPTTEDIYSSCESASTVKTIDYFGYESIHNCSRTVIANGMCDMACNIPECYFDGGDCITSSLSAQTAWYVNSTTYGNTEHTGFAPFSWRYPKLYENYIEGKGAFVDGFGDKTAPKYFFNTFSNSYLSFDEYNCGNSKTWSDVYNITSPGENRAYGMISWRYNVGLGSDDDLTDLKAINSLFSALGLESMEPRSARPYENSLFYSCDKWRATLTPSPMDSSSSSVLEWKNMFDRVINDLKNACGDAGEYWNLSSVDSCNFSFNEFYGFADENCDSPFDGGYRGIGCPANKFLSSLELSSLYFNYAWFMTEAMENSGSLYDLNFDISLQKDSSSLGYAATSKANHVDYFHNAGISSCTYSRRVELGAMALVSAIIGIIGGITAGSNLIGQISYFLLKRTIMKKRRSEDISPQESNCNLMISATDVGGRKKLLINI